MSTTAKQAILIVVIGVVVLMLISESNDHRERTLAADRRRTALAAVEIRDITFRITSADYLRISGRVYNAGRTSVRNVRVEARLLDRDGRVIAKASTLASVGELGPGEANPFELIERAQRDMATFETRVMVEE